MTKKLLKLAGIFSVFIFLLIATAAILFRIYSPQYFIPYVIDQVHEETNGRYSLTINSDSVQVHLISMNLSLGYTEFKRDSSVEDYAGIPFLDQFDVYANFESFEIGAFQLIKFLFDERIIAQHILLDQPTIAIRKNINYNPDKGKALPTDSIPPQSINYDTDSVFADSLAWEEFDQSRDALTPYIRINEFQIKKAAFSFYDGRKKYPIHEVSGLDLNIKRFISDENDDIEVDDAFIHIDSASSLVSKNIARLKIMGVYMNPDSVHIDALHFGHFVDPYQINKIKGFRASWLNIDVQDIDVQGINPGRLISDSVLNIDKTKIGFLNLYLFKDKDEPVINPAYKALPTEQVRNVPIPVLIDTLEIDNGKLVIDMEAPEATKPGRLIIDDMHTQIINITNIASELKKNPTMKFQTDCVIDDSIKVDLHVDFNISSPEDQFFVTCDVQPFHTPVLDSFLGSQFFIEFPSGKINYLHFEFEGNNKANVGTMDMEYEDLKIQKLRDYQKYIEGKPNTGFIVGVGNMLIPKNRSRQDKGYKQAVIYYEKEYNRDFIHGTIMSLVSGLASSVGFSSKNLEKKEDQANQLDESSTIKAAEKAQQQAEKAKKNRN